MAIAMATRPKKSSKLPDIEDLLILPKNPIRRWTESKENDYDLWIGRHERAKARGSVTQAELDEMLAWAYVTDDGFYHYCEAICGYKNMYEPFHGRMARLIATGKEEPKAEPAREWLLEAFRYSFKSSMASAAYPTWLIAREYMLSKKVREVDDRIKALQDGENPPSPREIDSLNKERDALLAAGELEGVNIRIGLQSEELGLATANLETCLRIMESPIYQRFFGDHTQKERAKGTYWGKNGAVSRFRTQVAQRDPTIWTISLDAPRIGRHFDVIISDDLQSERNAGSLDSINQCWHLYRLHFALIDPPHVSYYSISGMVATRWHYDDIYARIREENKKRAKKDRTAILKLPICDSLNRPTCLTIYPTKEAIEEIRTKLGLNRFYTQMMLEPTGDGTQAFQRDWIQRFVPPAGWRTPNMLAFTGVDFCWVEAARRNDTGSDHSVVFTFVQDENHNRYMVEAFREQCTRRRTVEEAARQAKVWNSVVIGMSISDRKHVEDDIKDFENRNDTQLPVEWVSDLKGGEGVSAATTKARKHIGVLQPLWQQKSMFILPGLGWFEEELLYCPRSRTDDGMDATVCAVVPSFPAMPAKAEKKCLTAADVERERWRKHTQNLLKGRPTKLDGTPLYSKTNPRPGSSTGRMARRARARVGGK
jgi:hypothetical protein